MSLKPPVDPNTPIEGGRIIYDFVGEFGGDPTGVLDSSGFLATAVTTIDAAGGGTLFFREGTYKFLVGGTNRIDIQNVDNVTFQGAGRGASILKFHTDNTRGFYLQTCVNFRFEGLTIRHANVQTVFNNNGALVEFVSCTKPEVEDCELYYSNSQCIVFNTCTHTRAVGNYCHESKGDGIHHVYCTGRMTCRDNHVKATQDDAISVNNYDPGVQAYGVQFGAVITGNLIEPTVTNGRGILVNGGEGVVVAENVIKGVQGRGIFIAMDGVFGSKASRKILVADNILIDCCASAPSGYACLEVGELDGSGFRTFNKVLEDIEVRGNLVLGGNNGGIDCYSVKRLTVSDNIVVDVNSASGVFATGLQVQQCNDVQVLGNKIRDTRGTPKMVNPIYLDTVVNVLASGNQWVGCALNAIGNTGCTALQMFGNSDGLFDWGGGVDLLRSNTFLKTNADFIAAKSLFVDNNGAGASVFFGAAADTSLSRTDVGVLKLVNALQLGAGVAAGTGFLRGFEQTVDPTPPANAGLLFWKDVGGKTALMAGFPTGAPVQIAIEP